MQFVKNGPEVPDSLLQAHEEGRVVFFCGAGISYPAGLPGFRGLVRGIYSGVGVTPNDVESAAVAAALYDTTIGLLESRIPSGRTVVREAVKKALAPDLGKPNALATHRALLDLARCRDGRTRLVTTNFDDLFEHALRARGSTLKTFAAPLLPVPKVKWNGLVYLHGCLASGDLDCLVLSSGDFGLAYLTERWAARFVSELFRNYTVCSVGYSISDPVLRYMMDALAADRLLGEATHEMYAFGSYAKGKASIREREWRAKNVTPILYREWRSHIYLHRTVRAWADTYRDGVTGRERIIGEYASALPQASTRQDDFVGRVMWALSDSSGLPARRFAGSVLGDPIPHLDWLEPLSEDRYVHDDLARFGVPLVRERKALTFSLLRRPAPYTLAPWMQIPSHHDVVRWDRIMLHLAQWLLHHLNDPRLIAWLVKHGGSLHPEFAEMIDRQLSHLAKLRREGNSDELSRIVERSPNAVPDAPMRTIWRLLTSRRNTPTHGRSLSLYDWFDKLRQDGLTATLRLELRTLLAPRVQLREPYAFPPESVPSGTTRRVSDVVDWEVALSSDHAPSTLKERTNSSSRWRDVLPTLLDDLDQLLHDAVGLMVELGDSDDDRSYVVRPSIADHPQNRDYRDWTVLVDLVRDSWELTSERDPSRATRKAAEWSASAHSLFRRLALHAATKEGIVSEETAVTWLLGDECRWLWSIDTLREAMRLIASLGARGTTSQLEPLISAILSGPPRGMYATEIDDDRWSRLVDHEVWLRLARLRESGAQLPELARSRLEQIQSKHRDWTLRDDQREEFASWTGDADEFQRYTRTPPELPELVRYLRENPETDFWTDDDWRERCRNDFAICGSALAELAGTGDWPVSRWREALQAWSTEELIEPSWVQMASTIEAAPVDVVRELRNAIAWWLQTVAKSVPAPTEAFFRLCERLLALEYTEGEEESPVLAAINHPVGHVTTALLSWWFHHALDDNQGLPAKLRTYFTTLSDTNVAKYRAARVLLATYAITLFRVDQTWTRAYLLPIFEWSKSTKEAAAAWQGFLRSPRLYRPFISAAKADLLRASEHYEELGEYGGQYAAFLTYLALDKGDTVTAQELRGAFEALPKSGLIEAAQALSRGIESAPEQGEQYFVNRIKPFWHEIWPKDRERTSAAIADDLARICIASGDAFEDAVRTLSPWLMPLESPDFVVNLLSSKDHCERFPHAALELLDRIISEGSWPPRDLCECLDTIERHGVPKDEPRLVRLRAYCRTYGLDGG